MTVGLLNLGYTPSGPSGKTNLGLVAPGIQSNSSPFINLWKNGNPIIYTVSGVDNSTGSPQGTTLSFGQPSAFPLSADINLENVVPQPAGTTRINRTLWQISTFTGSNVPGQYPPQYAGKQFTVDWTGATDWTVSVVDANGGVIASGTSAFTFTWPTNYVFGGGNVLIYMNLVPGNLANPPQNVRVYKTNFAVGGKTGAQRLALGEVIDPDYAAQIAAGAGTFRCMDWMATINNNVNNSFATFPSEAFNQWGGGGPSGLRGMPLSVIVKTALATNKNPHICIPSPMMCPKYKDLISITRATSPVITTAGPHNYANGDDIILNSMSIFQLLNPTSFSSSTFTTPFSHGMVNGYPLMLGTTDGQHGDTTVYPTPTQKAVPYWACNVTSTTFQIASTLANALAGTNITLTGALTGPILTPSISSITGGSLYTSGTYTNVPITGGSGSGMLATIVVGGGSHAVEQVTITNVGNNAYQRSDVLSCLASNVGGTGSGFSCILNTPNDGFGTITGGSGYVDGTYTGVPLTGGPGQGGNTGGNAQATIVISGGTVISVTITNSGVANNTGIVLYAVGQTLSASAANLGGAGSGFSFTLTAIAINAYLNMSLNKYTVSNSNPSASTLQITGPGSDTSILLSGSNQNGFTMMPFDLTHINTQVGLLAGYFRDNLPAPFCPTYEIDNEQWNFGTRVFFNFNGQGRWGGANNKFNDNAYQVMAYMNGVFAQAVKTAYAGVRSRYKMLFCGQQMYGDLFGAGLLAGWNTYVTDNPGVVATDLFDYFLGNTYFGSSYSGGLGSPQTATFGTNTIAFSTAKAGFPVKLSTTGALPAGLVAGTLGTAAASPASSVIIGTISGTTLTVLGNSATGNSSGLILAGNTIVLPDVIPPNTTVTQLTSSLGTEATFTGTISGTTLTVSGVTGTIFAGGRRLVNGAGVAIGTFIVSGSGTTWTVNNSQTVGPVSMTSSIGQDRGTYQLSNSASIASPTIIWCGTPFTPGTGTIYWLVGTGPNFGLALTPGGSPVAFTGPGTGTHTSIRCPDEVINFLMTQSLALHGSTPVTYPTPYTYFNQTTADDNFDARWTAGSAGLDLLGLNYDYTVMAGYNCFVYYYNQYLAPGKVLAGLAQTSYEGGFNGPPQSGKTMALKNDPTWQVMYYNSTYSAENGANFATQDALLRTLPGGWYKTSQFLDTNSFGVQNDSGIYGAKEYIGDTNPRWTGIVAANNS